MGMCCIAAACWFLGCNWLAWIRLEGVYYAVCLKFGPEEGGRFMSTESLASLLENISFCSIENPFYNFYFKHKAYVQLCYT